MNRVAPRPGERLTSGLLYRRVPPTDQRWDYVDDLPGKMAFQPQRLPNGDERENGISTYLTHLTDPDQVLEGRSDFGLVIIDIAEFLAEVEQVRTAKGVKPFGEVTVTFDPSDDPKDGAARHAHCYIEPMPAVLQKALKRLTGRRERIVRSCGPVTPGTGWSPDVGREPVEEGR